MFHTILGIVIGGFLNIGTAILVEFLRRPSLRITTSSLLDLNYTGQGRPAQRMRILNVEVTNQPLLWFARWMSRTAATQCQGTITFHHLDGQNLFGRTMAARWGSAPEPVGVDFTINGHAISFNNQLLGLMQHRDLYAGEIELLNVAARFDNEEDCYGWSNANYFSDPVWRNPDWKLPKGRFLVRVSIRSGEDKAEAVFRLVNDVGVNDFRLERAHPNDRVF